MQCVYVYQCSNSVKLKREARRLSVEWTQPESKRLAVPGGGGRGREVTRLANGGKLQATSWPAGKRKEDSNLQQKKREELARDGLHLKMATTLSPVKKSPLCKSVAKS